MQAEATTLSSRVRTKLARFSDRLRKDDEPEGVDGPCEPGETAPRGLPPRHLLRHILSRGGTTPDNSCEPDSDPESGDGPIKLLSQHRFSDTECRLSGEEPSDEEDGVLVGDSRPRRSPLPPRAITLAECPSPPSPPSPPATEGGSAGTEVGSPEGGILEKLGQRLKERSDRVHRSCYPLQWLNGLRHHTRVLSGLPMTEIGVRIPFGSTESAKLTPLAVVEQFKALFTFHSVDDGRRGLSSGAEFHFPPTLPLFKQLLDLLNIVKQCDNNDTALTDKGNRVLEEQIIAQLSRRPVDKKAANESDKRLIISKECGIEYDKRLILSKECGIEYDKRLILSKECGIEYDKRLVLSKELGIPRNDECRLAFRLKVTILTTS
ncbi:unnamed protein product [Timema podura]|uniref:Uncharacterized protein n=1 Tax=Timema podura TaxID=61482 RepID=A0ABN7NP33_TIMPD|nr:unnamed protein product [Timema podura]